MKEQKDDNHIVTIIGIIWGIAVIGAVFCGILECFSVKTGWVGGIFALLTILPLPIYVVWAILKEL